MPRTTTAPSVDEILASQASVEAQLRAAKAAFKRETLSNSVAMGKHIIRLRETANINRSQAHKVLGVSYASLYAVENPEKMKVHIRPQTQLRYLKAISQLSSGVREAAASVTFERARPGRRS